MLIKTKTDKVNARMIFLWYKWTAKKKDFGYTPSI
jgi:hypothetical protein